MPFHEIATLAAANIENACSTLHRRAFLYEDTFHPVVVAPQPLDFTVRFPPFSTSLRNGIIMLLDEVGYVSGGSKLLSVFLLSFRLALASFFTLSSGNTSSTCGALQLTRR
jgi:hypothetical protein